MKKLLAAFLALLLLFSFAGCAKEKDPEPPAIMEVFAFEDLIVNEGKNSIQIANINNEIHTPTLDALCARLDSEVYSRYERYDLKNTEGYLQIQSTIFEVEDYAQFVAIVREYPLSLTDGEMYSYVYCISQDKELTAADALAALGLTEQTLFDKTKAYLDGDGRGRELSNVTPAGCRVLQGGKMLLYYYVSSTTDQSEEAQREFFSVYQDTDGTYQIYDGCFIDQE